jgi:hypothetical protein
VETGITARPLRHRQTKGAETDTPDLTSTAPHSYSTVKTIAQGRPDDPAPPVVTTVRFPPMHTARGCELSTRSSHALLYFEGGSHNSSGAFAPRECGRIPPQLFEKRVKPHRRPGQASADPGPITTNVCGVRSWSRYSSPQRTPVVMGPGFRRDDERKCFRPLPPTLEPYAPMA